MLLRPPLDPGTVLLWAAPILILLTAALVVLRRWRQGSQPRSQPAASLTKTETERLNRLLDARRE